MNRYVVAIAARMGDVEKYVHNIVLADNEEQASKQALIDECHHEPDWKDDDGSFQVLWDDDQYVYKTRSIQLCNDEQLAVLHEMGLS